MNLSTKILKAIQKGLYEGLSQYDLTMLDDEDSAVVKNNQYKHQNIYDDIADNLLDKLPEFLGDNKTFKNIVEKVILTNRQYIVKDVIELSLLINKTIEIFGNECDLNWIDTSLITNMKYLFYGKNFNGHIENWDVSNVKDMAHMFKNAKLFNQSLNNWNVSNVENMDSMFMNAETFNQPLNNWNVSNIKDMSYMFFNTKSFNQPLNNWNVLNVENMSYMFCKANSFNQDISNWNTLNVTIKVDIFSDCPIKNEYKPKFNE